MKHLRLAILITCCIVVLSGCDINRGELDMSEKLCEKNGGISSMFGTLHNAEVYVTCENGESFTGRVAEYESVIKATN